MKSIIFAAMIVLSALPGSAQNTAMQDLQQMAETTPEGGTAEMLKSAADVQMAPVTGQTRPQTSATPAIVLPAVEGSDSGYHGGKVKKGASAGYDAGVKTVRFTGSIFKLPFAAIGGVVGGLIGAVKGAFASDDDDHTNNVGAGFMIGASAVGSIAGKVIQAILTIPALVVGAVGSVIGGIAGLIGGLFSKSEDK